MRAEETAVGGFLFEIRRNRRQKNLYVRVSAPEGIVKVSAPAKMREEEIKSFILKNEAEIRKIREKVLGREKQSRKDYVSGEAHLLWGESYTLELIFEGKRRELSVEPRRIIMRVPEGTDKAAREKLMAERYREELKTALPEFIRRCEEKTGLHADEYRVKNMKTRWGSCNIAERRIWINLQLAQKPPECLEYVLMHELTHLLEKKHDRRFYALLEKFCPGWKNAKKLLAATPHETARGESGQS